jgi:hypothetical protein
MNQMQAGSPKVVERLTGALAGREAANQFGLAAGEVVALDVDE